MNVAVLGASDKPDRYAYQAIMLLKEKGHQVFPVHPKLKIIEGIPVYSSLKDIPESVDTISLYLGPERSNLVINEIIQKKPRRVILNPGTENPILEERAKTAGIQVFNACTLVMLKTNQF